MFPDMNTDDGKPSSGVEPDGPGETTVGTVIADGATVRRERQSGMDSAPRPSDNHTTGRQRTARCAPAHREQANRDASRDVSQLKDAS